MSDKMPLDEAISLVSDCCYADTAIRARAQEALNLVLAAAECVRQMEKLLKHDYAAFFDIDNLFHCSEIFAHPEDKDFYPTPHKGDSLPEAVQRAYDEFSKQEN